MAIRILLVDDHRILREGLRSLLAREADLEVVGEAGEGPQALTCARTLRPDVAVMDIALPLLNGIDVTRQVCAECPATRVVALTAHSDPRYVLAMLEAGARGFVVKSAAAEELARAIRAVAGGQSYLGSNVAGALIQSYVGRLFPTDDTAFHLLARREREVVQLLAEGRTSKEIATRLGMAVKTVETHRRNVMRKLGLHGIADMTRYAVREGLVGPEA